MDAQTTRSTTDTDTDASDSTTPLAIWTTVPGTDREVVLDCSLTRSPEGGWACFVHASSGVGYDTTPEDAAALARIIAPAQTKRRANPELSDFEAMMSSRLTT